MEIKSNTRTRQEVTRAPIVVTHSLSSGSAFATRTDIGSRVYIPPKVVLAARIEVGGSYDANLIDNKYSDMNDHEHVEHVAVFVYPGGNRAEMLEQLLRRIEEGETTSRDANIVRTIFQDMRLIPAD